jgi:hypothetical protein
MMNEGREIGRAVRLANPVAAIRTLSLDPWLRAKVPLADGRQLTAVEIQREYLREAEAFARQGDCPDWAREVLDHWTTTLDQLERDPRQLARRLDTYLKLAIFDHEVSRCGYDWDRLKAALQLLTHLRRSAPEPVVRAITVEDDKGLEGDQHELYRQLAGDEQLKSTGTELLRFAVRLQALELKYHEVGGLFDQLAAAGHVDPVVVTPEEVQHAVHHPPEGRAQARSHSIAAVFGQPSWTCDWQGVMNHAEGEWFDMRDPFSSDCSRSKIPPTLAGEAARRRSLSDVVMGLIERR